MEQQRTIKPWLRIRQTHQTTVSMSRVSRARPSTQLSGWAGLGWGSAGSRGRPEPLWKPGPLFAPRSGAQTDSRVTRPPPAWGAAGRLLSLTYDHRSRTFPPLSWASARLLSAPEARPAREPKATKKPGAKTADSTWACLHWRGQFSLCYMNTVRVYFMYNRGKQASTKITAILSTSVFWYYIKFKSGKTVYKQIMPPE